MPFQILRDDLTRVRADAIVNPANPLPLVGRGTDSAVYAAAGRDKLLAARQAIGEIAPGHTVSTPAFRLHAKYILHTVGPAWIDGSRGEPDTLRACYRSSLALASDLGCERVAAPLLGSGAYGVPKDLALQIALEEIRAFLETHELLILLVVFDREALGLSEQLVGRIDRYIDEHTVSMLHRAEYGASGVRPAKHAAARQTYNTAVLEDACPCVPMAARKSLDEVLEKPGQTFQQRLFELIDERGLDDVTVYKKANVDRKVFSRIRCKPDYRPTKKTALAFAIALELDLPATRDLLSRAELAFSPSSPFDLIVSYFISNRVYDVFEINAALFRYGQPILE